MKKRYLFFISQPYSFAILRPLQSVIWERGDEVGWYFDGPGAHYLRPDEKRLFTIEEVKQYQPRAVFVPGNRVFDFFPGVKVEVFHGFPAGKRNQTRGHFRIRGFFDLYCTQGPAATRPFMELARKHRYFKVRETGWPKMDPLFRNDHRPSAHDRPVILYTSTFTRELTCAPVLLDTIRSLSRDDRWRWLVTFHPRMDEEIVRQYRSIQGDHLQFIETDDVIPLLRQADVMVSDTSSILSEFLLLHKPVVTFRNRKPGPYLIDIHRPKELSSAIESALSRPPALMDEIRTYADLIHPYRDGRSSERVLDAVEAFIENDLPHMPRKPLNLFRRLKLRKRMRYYHWK
ncbi:CDP-glycerol glycerophosphotransferase family protein [candidate division KSB1 bacterium]|nr:CDP-glycerol glycerophosphotransferase family protein [candidate division KSB1 bacterium]